MADKNFKVKNGLDATGTITATAFSGDGALLTNLPAGSAATVAARGTVYGSTGTNTSTALGLNSSFDITGTGNNTVIGEGSNISVGSNSIAAGYIASALNSSTAIGAGSIAGDQSVAVGKDSYSNYLNNIAIGYNAVGTLDNQIVLGDGNITNFRIPGLGISWTSTTIPRNAVSDPIFLAASFR